MKLNSLEKFNNIVIQVHDNPDADAVGSGFAIYTYFKQKGKDVRLIYSGRNKMTKSNMVLMVNELNIPLEYVKKLDKPELLITVDCQYGEGNVTPFEAENIAMIDHHHTGRESDDMAEIRSYLVSCATLCYDMLMAEKFDVNDNMAVATALYYGLFMDSNELSEIRHPLDRDMLDDLKINNSLINRFTHSNFTLEEMETAGIAMLRYNHDENKRLAIIKSKPCDPNILGIIGDFILQVDTIDVCIIFNECPGGFKFSVRSCIPDVTANDLAKFIVGEVGNGGGHLDKAGGFINENKFIEMFDDMSIDAYVFDRVEMYYDSFDIFHAKEGVDIADGFAAFRKKVTQYGYVKTTDICNAGTDLRIRTYEGDALVTADDDIYLMIGYMGEVYPITEEKFNEKYEHMDGEFDREFAYAPTVRNAKEDKSYMLMPYASKCSSRQEAKIYGKCLSKPAKVFPKWNYDKYMEGYAGDYICCSYNDTNDIYIVKKEIFDEIYEPILT